MNPQQMQQGNSPMKGVLSLLARKQQLEQEKQRLDQQLQQAAQQGMLNPMGPDGRPTVAGQLMPQGGPPGMPPQGPPQGMPPQGPPQGMPPGPGMQGAQQQAQLAAQMQMAQMQGGGGGGMPPQGPPPMDQGIAGAPGAQNVQMAEGGIVGYSGGPKDGSYVNLDDQAKEDRLALFKRVLMPLGYSLADLKQMPADVLNNTILRATRALGIPIPNIPSGGSNLQNYGRYVQSEATIPDYSKDLYGPEAPTKTAAPAPTPAPVQTQQQQPDKYAEALRILGAGGARAGMSPQLSALLADTGPTPRLPVSPSYERADAKLEENRELINKLRGPATPQEAAKRAAENLEVERQMLQARGIDPDQDVKNIASLQELSKRRSGEMQEDIDTLKARRQQDAITAFFVGSSGRNIGDLFRTGASASIKTEKEIDAQRQLLQKSLIDYQEASANKISALQAARRAEAIGDFKTAMADINAAAVFENQKTQAQAKINELQSATLSQRESDRVAREMEQYKSDRSAQTTIRGQNINALVEQQRMANTAANENMRARIELMLAQAKEKDSKLHQILSTDRILTALEKEIAELSKSLSPQAPTIIASKYDDMAKRINALRKEHNAPEIPIPAVIRGTLEGTRAPAR